MMIPLRKQKSPGNPGLLDNGAAAQCFTTRPGWCEKYAARSIMSFGDRFATCPCMMAFLRLPFL